MIACDDLALENFWNFSECFLDFHHIDSVRINYGYRSTNFVEMQEQISVSTKFFSMCLKIKKIIQNHFLFLFIFSFLFAGSALYCIHNDQGSLQLHTSRQAKSANEEQLEQYFNRLFQSELCSDTITMHYSLANPKKSGISVTRLVNAAIKEFIEKVK